MAIVVVITAVFGSTLLVVATVFVPEMDWLATTGLVLTTVLLETVMFVATAWLVVTRKVVTTVEFVIATVFVTTTVFVFTIVTATAGCTMFVVPATLVWLIVFVTTERALEKAGSGAGGRNPAGEAGNVPGPVGKGPRKARRLLLAGPSAGVRRPFEMILLKM
jgi:hypothetical protein